MNFHAFRGRGLTKTLRVMTSRTASGGSRSHRSFKKILLAMKLSVLFLIVFALHVSAKSYSQTISFSGRQVSMEKVFDAIKKQTGYFVFCDYGLLKTTKPVTIDSKNLPLEQFLSKVLENQPLEYSIEGNDIIISKKPVITDNKVPDSVSAEMPPADIHGKVTDSAGAPLVGASVTVKGTRKGTETDAKGEFNLYGTDNHATLVITYTGYESKEYKLKGNNNFSVFLSARTSPLDNVQVIAYGSTTQRLTTGNITVVNAKEIEQQPVSNPLLALVGRVPGLVVNQGTGIPGGGITVRIQGQNSIGNGNDPFFVVDGVPYSSQGLQQLGPNGQSSSPLNFINPSDIESISVLKDADATAIYGSRAANGAILITTKKGRAGDARYSVNVQSGWQHPEREVPLLNEQQYLAMRHEAIANDGLTVQPTDYDLNGTWDTTQNTDWQKTLIGTPSQYTNADISVSGGNANTQYLVGGTYNRQTPGFLGNFSDQKTSLHFSLGTVSSNKKLRFDLSASYLNDNNNLPGADFTVAALRLAPDAPPLYNKDGSLNWALDQNGNSTWDYTSVGTNPAAFTLQKYSDRNSNLVSNAVISYQILPGLNIKSSFGYTNQQVDETQIYPLTAAEPAARPFTQRSASYSTNNARSWIIEPQVDYRHAFGKSKLDALVGSTIEQNNSTQYSFNGVNYSSDLLLLDPNAAGQIFANNSNAVEYKYNAVFTRISYNYDDRFLLNLTGRRDGSSRFGPANEFHDFGAIGAGWIFSKEKFFQDQFPSLSFGKLKGSYGSTGNDQIGNYNFLSLYTPYGYNPYQGIPTIAPQGLSNPTLQWELTRKMEFGVDLGFAKDRILFGATYARNRSSNQLLPYILPVITGFGGVAQNFPATVQNADWEFTLGTVNIKTKSFTWSSHLNLTIPKNKLVSFPALATSSYNFLTIGKPISGYSKVYHYLGVNDTTGVYQFADIKGNPTSNPAYGTDNYVPINTNPQFYGGLANNFQYKGLELDFLFQFFKQKGLNYAFGNYPGAIGWGNQPTYVLNRWQKPGDHALVQRYTTGFAYFSQWLDAQNSDAGSGDASYARLTNLSLSWQLPQAWRTAARLQSCQFYVHAQNLLTITNYKGMDPANPYSMSLPPLRTYTAGFNVVF